MLLSESFRSVTTNVSTTIAATMTVLISMFVLGLVIALGFWVNSLADDAKDKLLVKVYFCTALTCKQEATPAQINATRVQIETMPEVERATFVSSDAALRRMRKQTPELVEGLASNPLPAAYEIRPRRGEDARLISDRLKASPPAGVEKIKDGEETQDRIIYVARVIFIISAIFVALLAIAAAMLIANTIRLSIFARRREIEVMKLVGATNWFVRGPFMIEGVVCALAGTVIALVLLVVGEEAAESLILNDTREIETIGFVWNAAILLAVGLGLGASGSAMTLRKFLRI
jgi:cell division transport system permease protein